ncbi:hypothetical protein [Streptomyces erythrochromogenes]|uniref:hypothetical protein n=1 Tax=Streptomyces erythrochromogenes TaxID=285574 RepID=UPI0038676EC7|nr:hypothetical protein OG489_35295 [Streptomyces erythrochromogenes]
MTSAVDRWHLHGAAGHTYSGSEAGRLLWHRRDWATADTWFESDAGRLLHVVTNGERAMVALLNGEGDPGEHLVDPRAEGTSEGYPLSNARSTATPAGTPSPSTWPPVPRGTSSSTAHGPPT